MQAIIVAWIETRGSKGKLVALWRLRASEFQVVLRRHLAHALVYFEVSWYVFEEPHSWSSFRLFKFTKLMNL